MANDLPECCDIKVQSIVHLVGTGLDTDLASTGQANSHSMLQQKLPHTNRDRQRERQSKVVHIQCAVNCYINAIKALREHHEQEGGQRREEKRKATWPMWEESGKRHLILLQL